MSFSFDADVLVIGGGATARPPPGNRPIAGSTFCCRNGSGPATPGEGSRSSTAAFTGSAAPIGCTCTTSPDSVFVLDRQGPVVVAAGFSGRGFTFVPAIGRVLAALAVDGVRPDPAFGFDRRSRRPASAAEPAGQFRPTGDQR